MTLRLRSWLAAALGLCVAHPLAAGEPARLGMTPTPPPLVCPTLPPNQQMANTIADQLRQGGQLRHYHIDIAYRDGVAELTGTVADQAQREEALRLVQGVPGVERVRDGLRVAAQVPVTQVQAFVPPKPTPEPAPNPNPANGGRGYAEPMPVYPTPAVPSDLNPPKLPPYAWPTYAPYNNFSRVAYPALYPYQSWPFIGPMYPFPKVPLGWRSVKLEWDDGYWWYSRTANGHDWWRVRYW